MAHSPSAPKLLGEWRVKAWDQYDAPEARLTWLTFDLLGPRDSWRWAGIRPACIDERKCCGVFLKMNDEEIRRLNNVSM